MRFLVHASTEKGNYRSTNQDSICVRKAEWRANEILMAVVCDGMGGLSKGELASAVTVRSFAEWFDKELPGIIENVALEEIGRQWDERLHKISEKMKQYGNQSGKSMGTTFTGILMMGGKYVMVHVGDSRIYKIQKNAVQLTADHTYVAREIAAGRMTEEEALHSPKRNTLSQCIGASKNLLPECRFGNVYHGDTFVICSDGFRHKITSHEMACYFQKKDTLENICSDLIQINMERGEKDNISVVAIKAD